MQNVIPNFENATGIFFFVLGIIIVLWIFFGETPAPEPPKPKDDPDADEQRRLGKEMALGNMSPEDVVDTFGYDIEHVKKWKQDYIDTAEYDHHLRKTLGL